MLDPAWNQGNYTSPPEQGIRLWRDILGFLAARSPEIYREQFPGNQLDVLPWLKEQETNLIKVFDSSDLPNLGLRPARCRHYARLHGDTAKALQAIKAKTLILLGTKDLLNPEWEPQDAARNIPDVKGRDHSARFGYRPCGGRRRLSRGRRLHQPRDHGIPGSGHGRRPQARLAYLGKITRTRPIASDHLAQDAPFRQYVALEGDEIVGRVRSVDAIGATWCADMYVSPSHRRRGIGQALLCRMLRDDRTRGSKSSVLTASHAGALLYPRVGYERIGTLLMFAPKRPKAS